LTVGGGIVVVDGGDDVATEAVSTIVLAEKRKHRAQDDASRALSFVVVLSWPYGGDEAR